MSKTLEFKAFFFEAYRAEQKMNGQQLYIFIKVGRVVISGNSPLVYQKTPIGVMTILR